MRQERQVFNFCLRKKQPVKRVIVLFFCIRTCQRMYRENVLVGKTQGNKSCLPAAFGKIRFVKGNIVRTAGMLQKHFPYGYRAVIDRVVGIKNQFPRFFRERGIVIQRPDGNVP